MPSSSTFFSDPMLNALETAAVGEDGAGPGHEPMQTAQPLHCLDAGAQVQVISVAQDDSGSRGGNFLRGQGLDGGLGRHRHESRRCDNAVGRG